MLFGNTIKLSLQERLARDAQRGSEGASDYPFSESRTGGTHVNVEASFCAASPSLVFVTVEETRINQRS
jgi:hypothetical protein